MGDNPRIGVFAVAMDNLDAGHNRTSECCSGRVRASGPAGFLLDYARCLYWAPTQVCEVAWRKRHMLVAVTLAIAWVLGAASARRSGCAVTSMHVVRFLPPAAMIVGCSLFAFIAVRMAIEVASERQNPATLSPVCSGLAHFQLAHFQQAHGHGHGHEHAQGHERTQGHGHGHGHERKHGHEHAQGHERKHGHAQGQGHGHGHEHGHGQGHGHERTQGH